MDEEEKAPSCSECGETRWLLENYDGMGNCICKECARKRFNEAEPVEIPIHD